MYLFLRHSECVQRVEIFLTTSNFPSTPGEPASMLEVNVLLESGWSEPHFDSRNVSYNKSV